MAGGLRIGIVFSFAIALSITGRAGEFKKNEAHVNVLTVQKILNSKGAEWRAKDSWVNHLSSDKLKHLFGSKETPRVDAEFEANRTHARTAAPTSIDWRNVNGVNYVSPMLNQGNCGSCVAFASVATLETQLNISSAIPGLNMRLSPQALFACGGGGCDSGWWPSSAAEYLADTGVPEESCAPYTMGATGQDVACSSICADAPGRSVKIAKYTTPTTWISNLSAVKAALAKGPLMTTMTVYSDFLVYSSGVYKHTTGSSLGGHAISIVGYDDATQSLIIRNSWGEDWGEKGFAHISYRDTSGIGQSTWAFEVPATAGYASFKAPMDYEFVAGDYQLSAFSTYGDTHAMEVVLFVAAGKKVWSQACSASPCTPVLPTTQLADGKYEVYANVSWGSNETSISSHQLFYIANQKPQMTLGFSGQGFSLPTTIKDRVVFDVQAHSSTVPFTSLTFHAKGPDGVDHARTTKVVLPDMTLGWRSNFIPNGQYEIWMTGEIKTNLTTTTAESQHYTVTVRN